MIQFKSYSINKLTLTNQILVLYINRFWVDIFTNIKDNSHIMLMCKVQFSDESMSYRTLGHLRSVNFTDKELFIDYLSKRLTVLNDSYITVPITKITFSYITKTGFAVDTSAHLLDLENKSQTTHIFNNMILPITMNPNEYGEIIVDNYVQLEGEYFHRFVAVKGDKTYQIDVYNDGLINKVRILGNIDLSWMDTKIGEIGTDIFKREIKKSTIYFMDGEKVLRKQILNAKPFRKLVYDAHQSNNFYTIDIETTNQNGKLIPYLICAFDGKDYVTSYGNDQKSLFTTFFNQLLSNIKPGSTTTVYAHNLSNFDGVFLLRHLLPIGKVEPLIFNGKLMSIKVKIAGNKKSQNKMIIFKDSYLLLPLSLRRLCIAFGIGIGKGYFPFLLSNIFYTGILPKFEHWTGISISEYESIAKVYKNRMWSFQQESIKYCKLDCLCLYEILIKFNELIFNEFSINIHNSITLPALAMRIFKTHFMTKDTIYQILGNPFHNISESYTGGAVDIYIPHNRITSFVSKVGAFFKRLYLNDVNSLYPSVMAKHPMPIGKPIYFDGDIRKVDGNAYGFFYCKITSPDTLMHPLIQRRMKTSAGIRTIAGLGTWHGWINSLEMDNAMKYGYTFEILKGYQFETGDLFSGYINKMYTLRNEYPKGDPMNLIAKLLMNSLYGKFGMKLNTTRVDMYDTSTPEAKEDFMEMLETLEENLLDSIKIDDTYIIIRDSIMKIKYDESLDIVSRTRY